MKFNTKNLNFLYQSYDLLRSSEDYFKLISEGVRLMRLEQETLKNHTFNFKSSLKY